MSQGRRSTQTQGGKDAMSATKLIIAHKDYTSRLRIARMLIAGDGEVETTGSAACLMESLMRGGRPVVVLADGLEEELTLAALVPLLKSCNPHATIILVADDLSWSDELKMRQQGIFYRTHRPVCAAGWDELQLAVACACKRIRPAGTPVCAH